MSKQFNNNVMKNLNCKTMRKLVFTLLMLLSLSLSAQNYIVKFLGIPVDGSKSEMISKLKKKNFTYDSYNDQLSGNFNGKDVDVMIHTNNDVVDRICVIDKYDSNSSNIKISFNNLIKQFQDKENYIEFPATNMLIAEDDDLSYEMSAHDKRYQAVFHQERSTEDLQILWNDSIYVKKWISDNDFERVWDSLYNSCQDEEDYRNKVWGIFKGGHRFDAIVSNDVWFMISDFGYGKYRIVLYYDNNKNRPNGEDL